MDFPNNSHAARIEGQSDSGPNRKRERERILKSVEGPVRRRKKTLGARFIEAFTGDENKNVLDYIVFDVLIPSAKDLLYDAFTQGLERRMFGEVRSNARRGPNRSSGSSGYTPYNRMNSNSTSSSSRRETHRPENRRNRMQSFDDVILESREEAETVLESMYDDLETYGLITVRELYEYLGENFHHTDNNWGWLDLKGSSIVPIRGGGGYVLNLPKPVEID